MIWQVILGTVALCVAAIVLIEQVKAVAERKKARRHAIGLERLIDDAVDSAKVSREAAQDITAELGIDLTTKVAQEATVRALKTIDVGKLDRSDAEYVVTEIHRRIRLRAGLDPQPRGILKPGLTAPTRPVVKRGGRW